MYKKKKRETAGWIFFLFYFAEHIVKVLHWRYSTVIVWFCIAIVHWFTLFYFYDILYDFSLGNWELDVWNTSGFLSVCNIVVKPFRQERKKKKKHAFSWTDGVKDFYITIQALLISQCISWHLCLMLNVKGQSTDIGSTRITIAFISASLQNGWQSEAFNAPGLGTIKGKKGFSCGSPLCSSVLTFSHVAESPFLKVSIKVASSLLLS